MEHHRTSLKKGLDLVHKLSSSGEFSGRAKPKYAVLSDIGKIVLYEDTILKKDIQEHKKQNEIMITKINNLTQKSDLLKINQSIESESDSNYTKKKIDHYIREIEKCINLIDNRNV